MIQITIPPPVMTVLETLNQADHEGWVVGGCVRDSLLGMAPHDWDVCTSAQPRQVIELFSGYTVIETGLKHGTVTVLVDTMPVEITTFRVDGSYSDGRRPDQVTFTGNIQADLARRDFTINAIAYHPKEGIADYFGGIADLERKQVRCVGEATLRFGEDALRILRMFRISARLCFVIDEGTFAAAALCRDRLSAVSAERIAGELVRILTAPQPAQTLGRMVESGVMDVILPEFTPSVGFDQCNRHHDKTVDAHILASVDSIPSDRVLRLTMLLHDIAKPATFTIDENGTGHFYGHGRQGAAMARKILMRLKLDNATIDRVTALIKHHDDTIPCDLRGVKRILSKLGEDTVRQLLKVKRADNLAQAPAYLRTGEFDSLEELLERIICEKQCFALGDLTVKGRDLLALGLKEDRRVGLLLDYLLRKVVADELPNEREALLGQARIWIEAHR